ncbi:MAG TPA: hypothetical protein VGD94_16685 [Vicinamibacterales bacterium]
MQRAFLRALMLAAAVAVAGCDNDVEDRSPTEPPPTVTETFEGTITPNGAMTHTFNVSVGGTVTATLLQSTPDPGTVLGFAIGTWNPTTSTCQTVISNDNAAQGTILTGAASRNGTLCARIYDTGRLTAAVSYTISVTHP